MRATADTLPHEPALRLGTLPNGLRYYIRANPMPAKRAALWLAVNAGSVQEDDDQQGFAHFLEHMAFNGTKHFPRHELISTLQLAGMRFGADINAYTSYDETVYSLEVPTDQPKFLQQGLTMLEDWAGGGILIDSTEVVAERGVVVGEWRFRLQDSLGQTITAHRDSLLYGPESRYITRPPIGRAELLKRAEPEPLRRFYRDWYRPDLMAVVVVGDIDPVRVEREIRTRFGKIAMPDQPRRRVSPRLPSHSEPMIDIYKGLVQPGIQVMWKEPAPMVETKTAFRQSLVEDLLWAGLQQRFQRLSTAPRRPFVGATIGRIGLPVRGASARLLYVTAWPTDSLERGLAVTLTELERIAQHGVPGAALERQKAIMLRQLESAVAQRTSIPSQQYVQAFVQHFLQGGDALLTPQQQLALARELLPTITPDDLARAGRFWRNGSDRLTLVSFPSFTLDRIPTKERIAAIFDSVASLQLTPDSAKALDHRPLLATAPPPGRIVGETRHAKADVTEWRLSNGARVLFKPTRFNPDELLIRATSPGGWTLLPDTLFYSPGRLVAGMMTYAAGLGTRDRDALLDQLSLTALRDFEVSITPMDESIRLGGSPRDLETLFQLLYLQFTAPKLDTAAIIGWKAQGGPTNGGRIEDQLATVLSRNHPRLAGVSGTLVPLADTATALAVYRDRFGNAGDFTFTIVGAATAKQVRPLVERYIASLPSTDKRESYPDFGLKPWKRRDQATGRVLPVPRAQTQLQFFGLFPSTPEEFLAERRRLDALAWTLRLKFTDELREQMSATYGTGVSAATVAIPQEAYLMSINFDGAPERIDGMIDTMFVILDSVRSYGATPQELEKIAAMQRREREVAMADNRYWASAIATFDRLKIPFERIVTDTSQRTTPAEVREAARKYMPADTYIHMTYMPVDTSWKVKPDSARTADSTSRAPTELTRRPR